MARFLNRALIIGLLITLFGAVACQNRGMGALVAAQDGIDVAAAQQATTTPEPLEEPEVNSEVEPVESESGDGGESEDTLPATALMNGTYSGIYEEPVTLSDGLYEGEPYGEGDTARPIVQYKVGTELTGDLDGDGAADAIVFLEESGGGTAEFIYISAQLNEDGQAVDAGALRIEGVAITSATLEDGQIELDIITHGPSDGECCASHKASVAFAVEDGELVQTVEAGEELAQLSAADLAGTSWVLVELKEGVPVIPGSEIILNFDGDEISGSAGCNIYGGSFTLGEESPFTMTISPMPTTVQSCPDETGLQETAYFAALDSVSQWSIDFGRLSLYYLDAETVGLARLLFTPDITGGEEAVGRQLPAAEIANDEGGPAAVTGEWAYTSSYVGRHYTEPVAILKDVSDIIQGDYTEWVPPSGQIMGVLTRPLAPSPTAYAVNLPVKPSGKSVDLDNDGQEDAGVQILTSVISSNLAGDSYLEQIEQDGFTSYLKDPQTGAIRQGTFLVYAPDDQQGFPAGAGEDGVFFTEDDPAVALPAGYTHVTLSEDGQVTFDRSLEVSMPILEAAAFRSPDFSDQGILESYDSLIALLKERYSYTDLRGLDWDAIGEEYLPAVEAADEADSLAAYYATLNKLALSIRDAHVFVNSRNRTITADAYTDFEKDYSGSLGAKVVEMSDGRFVVVYIAPDSPASAAGWQAGTEIISVDGVPIAERIEDLPLFQNAGNPEVIRLNQTNIALNFPPGAETTVEYLQPNSDEPQTATLTAQSGAGIEVPGPAVPEESISFRQLEDDSYYLQWQSFDDELYKMAVFEKFLEQAQAAPGVIIDLRHNGGGSVALLYAMASYFFSAEEPATLHWLDEYTYDDQAGDLVQQFATDYPLSSPKPDLTYQGVLAVLVGPNSASAAEYLPQFLQQQGRAIVVGEHGTEGAGGAVEFVAMPGGFEFLFTKGRTYFTGTDELNLEQKGVELDVRVPVTLENELAKQEGRDVVLEAAVETLVEEAARLTSEKLPGTIWQLQNYLEVVAASGTFINEEIADRASYSVTFENDGQMSIKADCNMIAAEYSVGSAGAIAIEVGPAALTTCAEGSLSENFINALGEVNTIQAMGDEMALQLTKDNGDMIYMVLQKTADNTQDAAESAPSAEAEE